MLRFRRVCNFRTALSRLGLSGVGMEIAGSPSVLRDSGNGVFENQLFLRTGLEKYRKLIKTSNSSGQLRPVEKVDNDCGLLAADSIQKRILDILGSLLSI